MSAINPRNSSPIGSPSNEESASSEGGACWDELRIDRLKALRSFCLAARLGSITRAADKLSATQPLVSAHVRVLEESFGEQLFDRRRRRIALTPAGEALFRLANPLVASMDRLRDTFRDGHLNAARGVLTIGSVRGAAAHLLPRYLKRFHAHHPGVRVQVRTGTSQQILGWLRGYEMDLVVCAMDAPPSDLAFHPILDSAIVLVTPESHPLAGRKSVAIAEAASYPFIAHTSEHYIAQAAEAFLRRHRVLLNVVLEVDGWDAITSHVAAGVGVAFVPEFCIRGNERVRKLTFTDSVPPRRYGAVIRRDTILSRPTSLFLRTLAPYPPELSEQP